MNESRVNDVHCGVSETQIRDVVQPSCIDDIRSQIAKCRDSGTRLSVAGGRHSLGRQPFCTDGVVLDLSRLGGVRGVDSETGIITASGGCQWPEVKESLQRTSAEHNWEVHQKQTGAGAISLAGSVAVNAHGNPLGAGPISSDIEWLTVITADGTEHFCDRSTNTQLFSLVISGYGLFGVVTGIGLRLVERQNFRRHSRWCQAIEFAQIANDNSKRDSAIYHYADMQLDIAPENESFLQEGVLNAWQPTSLQADANALSNDWHTLVGLAHCDKGAAVRQYRSSTERLDGQIESRDHFMWHAYTPHYHQLLESQLKLSPGGDLLSEFFSPANELPRLLAAIRSGVESLGIEPILATLRATRACQDSYLRWANQDYVCLVLAMHFTHGTDELARIDQFCADTAGVCAQYGGSFYMPYRVKPAREDFAQMYPNFPEFCRLKAHYDPENLFWNQWFEEFRETYAPVEHSGCRT